MGVPRTDLVVTSFIRCGVDKDGAWSLAARAHHGRRKMKRLAFALMVVLACSALPANAAERACRPSLSNFYHCPDASKPAAKTKTTSASSGGACRPSLSNLWTCPGTTQGGRRSTGTSGAPTKPAPSKTTSAPERGCRPSLSNGFKCPGEGPGANQYRTETQAWAHCPSDTVVWANTHSDIYHFRGTFNYGTTVAGAYMCEHDALAEGMRAAKNEKHP